MTTRAEVFITVFMRGIGMTARLVRILVILYCARELAAQGILRSGTLTPISPNTLANHHIDAWSIVASSPIRTLNATVLINPMNQVQPGGSLSVFPTALSPAERQLDSHFLFDVSSANVLEQNENGAMVYTRVEFTSNFPTSFDLVKIVAQDGHTPFEVYVSGTYLDGAPFGDNLIFVPEPGVCTLLLLGFGALLMRRRVVR